MALTDKLTAIANGFRTSRGTQDKYTLDQMAVLAAEKVGADPVINPLSITANGTYTASDCDGYSPITVAVPQEGAPTAEELTFSGNLDECFNNGNWDWFINKYGDQITTKDITRAEYMFTQSNLATIPFEINLAKGASASNLFSTAQKLTTVPKINASTITTDSELFYSAYRLRNIPEDIESWFDWSVIDNATGAYEGSRSGIFESCASIRSIPMGYLNHGNPVARYSVTIYYRQFYCCYALDEIVGLPVPHKNATWTSNAFNSTFGNCSRLKNMTFALDPETNAPYVANWTKQTIDLSSSVGYGSGPSILNYNSGITVDKLVKDDATYQALKDDPDWYTTSPAYSRYNHDSAVATINSLPDTIAAGGGNTIKFKGAAGEQTDGGAINTLTEEEMYIAESKGWTIAWA